MGLVFAQNIPTRTTTGWYGIGMNNGTLVYNMPTGQQHNFQFDGVQKTYISINGDIYKYSSAAPPNANCIGYSAQVNISQSTNETLNASASYLSINLPYAGTYDYCASIFLQYSCDYIFMHNVNFSISKTNL